MKLIDLTGQKFGRLTVISRAENKGKRAAWNCLCECGNKIIVRGTNLQRGTTKSCGCLKIELTSERHRTHGKRHTKLYNVWCGMKARCYNQNQNSYPIYGGKGITVCKEWLDDFNNFYQWAMQNGYADGLTIERKDGNNGYCPENCEWIPKEKQSSNLCTNIVVEHNGERRTLADWARIYGVSYKKFCRGFRDRGLSFEKAIEYASVIKEPLKVEYNGEYLTIAELAEKSGLNKRKLQRKIYEQHKNAYEAIHDIIQTEKRKAK